MTEETLEFTCSRHCAFLIAPLSETKTAAVVIVLRATVKQGLGSETDQRTMAINSHISTARSSLLVTVMR